MTERTKSIEELLAELGKPTIIDPIGLAPNARLADVRGLHENLLDGFLIKAPLTAYGIRYYREKLYIGCIIKDETRYKNAKFLHFNDFESFGRSYNDVSCQSNQILMRLGNMFKGISGQYCQLDFLLYLGFAYM